MLDRETDVAPSGKSQDDRLVETAGTWRAVEPFRLRRPSARLREWLAEPPGMVALAIYAVLAGILFGKPLLRGGLACVCAPPGVDPLARSGADASAYMWAFEWWPYAISHGLNPLYTHLIYAPEGVNLAHGNILIPGAAVLLAPVTAAAGPLFSFNVAMVLSPVLAAFFAFLLCRRLTGAFWPSVIGGWLFGFSTYMLGQLTSHLVLTVVFLVPAIVHLTLRGVAGEITRRRFVALLALALTLQFSFSVEVLASLTLFGAIAYCIAYSVYDAESRARLRALLGPVGISYLLTAVIVSPYLYFALKPGGIPIVPGINDQVSNDLLGLVVPTRITSLGGQWFVSITRQFTAGQVEGGAYLGLPLILVLVLAARHGGRRPEVKVTALTLLVVVVLSLGAHLHVMGATEIPMPWALVYRLPVFGLMLPARFIVYGALISAMMAAVWLATARRGLLSWMLVLLSVAFLWPAARHRYWHSDAVVPKLFAGSGYRQAIGPRDIALVPPVGIFGHGMLWQAEAHLGFTMASGYVVPPAAPDPYKRFSIYPTLAYGYPVPHEETAAATFIASNHVTVAVLDPHSTFTPRWMGILEHLGWKARTFEGVILLRPDTTKQTPMYVSR